MRTVFGCSQFGSGVLLCMRFQSYNSCFSFLLVSSVRHGLPPHPSWVSVFKSLCWREPTNGEACRSVIYFFPIRLLVIGPDVRRFRLCEEPTPSHMDIWTFKLECSGYRVLVFVQAVNKSNSSQPVCSGRCAGLLDVGRKVKLTLGMAISGMAGKPRTPQCVYNYSLVLSGG